MKKILLVMFFCWGLNLFFMANNNVRVCDHWNTASDNNTKNKVITITNSAIESDATDIIFPCVPIIKI
jgi:hypothetical protein